MKNLELCYGHECHDKIIKAIKNNQVIIIDKQNLTDDTYAELKSNGYQCIIEGDNLTSHCDLHQYVFAII